MKLLLPALLFLTSCLPFPEDSKPTVSSLHLAVGDILVGSSVTDSVYQFRSDGTLVRVLWRTTLATEAIGGLGWKSDTNEVLISINGTPDRVIAVSAIDGRERVLVNNTNFTGTPRGLAQMASGDLVLTEGATMERTTSEGIRVTYAGVWPSSVLANVQDLRTLSDGSWVAISSTAGMAKYDDSTTAFAATATATGPAGATTGYGVAETDDGKLLVSWAGAAADYLSLYDSSLALEGHVISNVQGLLQDPRGVAVKRDGNFLVADNTLDYVIEVTPDGDFVKFIGQGTLDGADGLLVVPSFSP